MGKLVDLTGKSFGRWTVLGRSQNKNKKPMWRCICSCSKRTENDVPAHYLKNGSSKSCGCLKEEKIKNGDMRRTHGKRNTKEYSIWLNIRNRCYRPKTDQYHNYGGRGITVCEEWLNKENGFINFYNWAMENGYEEGLSIDRKNVNGNYEPDNCRWVTIKEQQNNRRNNHLIIINGITKTISMWEDEYDLIKGTISNRLKRGWTGEQLLIKPLRKSEVKSGEKGITWNKTKQKWAVQIKRVFLGNYEDLNKAIEVKYNYINKNIKVNQK